MRALFPIAAILALAACGKNPAETTQNADQSLTPENIVSNDVTAIDAVTGDAANMAADVPISADLGNNADETSNQAGESRPAPRAARAAPAKSAPAAANESANSATNAQ